MSEPADVDPLIGRHFVSKSGNVGRFKKLETGAMQMIWRTQPSDEDVAECHAWSIIGPLNITAHREPKTEAQALERWRKR